MTRRFLLMATVLLLLVSSMPSNPLAQTAGSLRVSLLSAVTTGTSQYVNAQNFTNLAVFVTGVGTVSAGTMLVEEAEWNPTGGVPYGGTWSQITSLDLTNVTAGKQQAYHFPVTAYAFVRVRISSNVTGGGTVSAVLRGVQ